MRILTFDELDPVMEADRSLLHLAAFGGTWPRRSVELERSRFHRLAEYGGVFGVEHGRLVGQVFVWRIPYAFPDGPGIVGGVAAVATRPDRGGRGIAGTLLRDVHRREADAGVHQVALWTNASWGAHRLYERLGYRDLYAYPWAVHAPGSGRRLPPRPRSIRPARTSDLDELERLHNSVLRGRWGFAQRTVGAGRAAALEGRLDPAQSLLVAHVGPEITGYAHVDRSPLRSVCGELVARTAAGARALIAEVLRKSSTVPVAFQHTPVSEAPERFRGPRFVAIAGGWHVLMGRSLDREGATSALRRTFGTADPRFVCMAGDRF